MTQGWWCEFFDERVASCILPAPRAGELDFLTHHLGLKPGMKLFDQCCGWGRVSGPLSEQGLDVWGVDASQPLIANAEARWSGHYILGDASEHHQSPVCDAAMNLYSSFGYSPEDEYNQSLLDRLVESVKPGGRILLDTINPERVYGAFEELMTYRTDCGAQISRLSELRDSGRLLSQDWTFVMSDGGRFEKKGGLTRLYSAEELKGMLIDAGARPIEVMGDLNGRPYSGESQRLIWLVER